MSDTVVAPPRIPRSLVEATADYKGAIASGDSMCALSCLQDLMYHKVGDITKGVTDTQMAQMMEMEFGCNMQALLYSTLNSWDIGSSPGLVSAVEEGITNKGNFLTQKAKDGAKSAFANLDLSESIISGIKDCSTDLIDNATEGATKALGKVDFGLFAQNGAAIALSSFDFKEPARIGASTALSKYNFVDNAKEGAKLAIDDKRTTIKDEAANGANIAIQQSASKITGYAQSAIGNAKSVITSAAEQAIVNRRVSTQEEVRNAILAAYSSYALALDNAKSSFKETISQVINQTVNLNDATVQYQVLLLSTSEAADRLVTTAESFKDVVFTAERYASTITDVLAIQQLQQSVLDTTKVAINSISQLRSEWATDRKELFDTMSDVRKLQDVGTKFDMAYKSLQVALDLTERIQEGIKMKSPEIVY